MKKGIVMEQHRKYTIMMTKEGTFQKAIPINDAEIGTEVSFKPLEEKGPLLFFSSRKQKSRIFKMVAIVCILFVLFVPSFLFMNADHTYAYVNVAINPNIELEVNEDMDVDNMLAVNNDADNIVKELTEYQDKELEKVIEKIIENSKNAGLVNNEQNVLIGVSYKSDKNDNDSLLSSIEQYLVSNEPDWNIVIFEVPSDVREMAKEAGKSMNEIMATKLLDKNSSVKTVDSLNDEEMEIIDTFYNEDDKGQLADEIEEQEEAEEKTEKESDNAKDDPVKEEKGSLPSNKAKNKSIQAKPKGNEHPSELKEKNSKTNPGNGNSSTGKGNNGKADNKGNNGKGNNGKSPDKWNNGKGNNGKSPDKWNNGKGNNSKSPNKWNNGKGNNGKSPDKWNNGKGNNGKSPDKWNNGKGNNGKSPDKWNNGKGNNGKSPDKGNNGKGNNGNNN
ncbi:anti-sigma factor domain-containing protein [Virgibacillus ainsalahensis]